MQYFFFTNSSRISIGKLTCNQNHRSVLHIAGLYFFSGVKRRRRHFLLEMPQIASRGNFIVTRIFTRPIDRTTFCQSGSEMPEARRSTVDERHVRESGNDRGQTILHAGERHHSHGYLKVRNNAPSIFFLSYVDSAPCPRRGSLLITSSPSFPRTHTEHRESWTKNVKANVITLKVSRTL